MVSSRWQQALAILASAVFLAPPVFAFSSPLSSEAIREAYFLGQRHDESMARFLDKYTTRLSPPRTGPYISSVQFLTPFAQLIQVSDQHLPGYSAQQAERERRGQPETVEISVKILLTESYPAFVSESAPGRSGSTPSYHLRSPDFWRDFQVRVFQRDEAMEPADFTGRANYSCTKSACTLSGATLWLDFPATALDSDSATVEVTPPVGDPVAVDFDLTRLR
jgi:hypothetical protein